jgi:hypothetical protein
MHLQSIKSVPVPSRLAARPVDRRGYPIPYSVIVDSKGVPDFRVTDVERWMFAVNHRRCGMCGEPLGRKLAFVGGPLCHPNRYFTDLPMHRDCAEYALRVCPYLALPKASHAQTIQEHEEYGTHVSLVVSTEKPDRFMLGITEGYKPYRTTDGSFVLKAEEWLEAVWWKDGQPLGDVV